MVVDSMAEALAGITDGATIMVGGFGLVGMEELRGCTEPPIRS